MMNIRYYFVLVAQQTTLVLALVFLLFGAASFCSYQYKSINLIESDYKIGDSISVDWNYLCISPEYEIPDTQVRTASGVNCKLRDEVPVDTVFLVFVGNLNNCEVLSVHGELSEKDASTTICYERSEVENSYIFLNNGVVQMRDHK
jgi:hypothetical protein